jgi:uncharacterized protein YggT (Ycf19 family)
MESNQPTQPAEPEQPVQPVQPVRQVEREYVTRPAPEDREVVVDHYRSSPAARATQVVYLVLGIVEALLIIRIVLKLLAANASAGFTNLIYTITNPLVALFQGVFPEPQSNGSMLDLAAILALVVYALVAWGIVRLIWISRRQGPPAEV